MRSRTWNKGKKGQSTAWPSTGRLEAKQENRAKHGTVCGGRAEAKKTVELCTPLAGFAASKNTLINLMT